MQRETQLPLMQLIELMIAIFEAAVVAATADAAAMVLAAGGAAAVVVSFSQTAQTHFSRFSSSAVSYFEMRMRPSTSVSPPHSVVPRLSDQSVKN